MGNSVEPLPEGLWSSIASRLPERPADEEPPPDAAPRGDPPQLGAALPEPPVPPAAPAPLLQAPGHRGALAVAAAAVAVVLGINLVHANNQSHDLQRPPGPRHRALGGRRRAAHAGPQAGARSGTASHASAGPSSWWCPTARATWSSRTLPALPSAQTYQLWGIVDGQPISLGLLGDAPNQATFTLAGSRPVAPQHHGRAGRRFRRRRPAPIVASGTV